MCFTFFRIKLIWQWATILNKLAPAVIIFNFLKCIYVISSFIDLSRELNWTLNWVISKCWWWWGKYMLFFDCTYQIDYHRAIPIGYTVLLESTILIETTTLTTEKFSFTSSSSYRLRCEVKRACIYKKTKKSTGSTYIMQSDHQF